MKKRLLIIPFFIAAAISFYPTISTSNATGSPGGKTNSPMDGATCTDCHYTSINTGTGSATITSNIPANGYVLGNTYTITLTGVKSGCSKFGFELTAEDANGKAGSFMITDNTTKLVNGNKAVTHKSSGNSGNTTKTWSVDWTPSTSSTATTTTFYAALMFADGNGQNSGDNLFTASLTANKAVANSIYDYNTKNAFTFNTSLKTIEANEEVLVYDINGRNVFKTNDKNTNISHLKNGIYILKSKNKTQKIIIN